MAKHKCKADGAVIASTKYSKNGLIIGSTITTYCKQCGLPVRSKVVKD